MTRFLNLALGALLWARAATAAPADPDLARFIAAKSNQVYLASRDSNTPVPPEVWQLFAAASASDWKAGSNLLQSIRTNYYAEGARRLAPEVWYPVQEVGGFGTLLSSNSLKFIHLFASEIFKVVPPGSIYFGGTDPGRFAITALSQSQAEGKPFLTLTQNQLVDSNYLAYISGLYRGQIKLPGDAQVRAAFNDYLADAQRRYEHDQQFPSEPKEIKAGENVQMIQGRPQISGQVAVMAINGLLVRDILQDNPRRDCYIEESFALDWMYPQLEPAGPIFKLRHAPLKALFEETVRGDREYWQRLTRRLIGQEVHDETSLEEVCAAARELMGKPKDFQGDPDFLLNPGARLTFSKLRSSIGGLYDWRATHARSTLERRQMEREAETAFKQSYMLWPRCPEAIWRYTLYLIRVQRVEDARKFVAAAQKLNPADSTLAGLADYARQMAEYEQR